MGLGYNKKSLRNLNSGKEIVWNGRRFKSFAHMARATGYPSSSIQDRYNSDRPVGGHYVDEVIK